MTHTEARSIVREAWRRVHGREPTDLETLYAQAIALLETGYGRAGQFGKLAAEGKFNWGALQRRRGADGECPTGFAAGSDQGPVCFFVFPSDVEAATAFVRVLTKLHWPTVEAMSGSPEDVAAAMRVAPAYYAGLSGSESDRINAYANAIRGGIRAIGQNLPLPALPSGFPWLLAFGLAGGAGYLYYREYGTPDIIERMTRATRLMLR